MSVNACAVTGPRAARTAAAQYRLRNRAGIGANCALEAWTFIVAALHSAQQKMRGRGRAVGFLVAAAIFSGACTFGGNSTIPTAQISPESSPSSTTTNPVTSSPPVSSPSAPASPVASGLAVAALPVHNGDAGVGYLAVSFQATGGSAPYTWSVSAGTLPPRLTLSPRGVLNGNNTPAGQFNFTAQVKDSTAAP